MKPMLLPRETPDLSTLTYPLHASPKLDGIRCLITKDGPLSRTLKPIPNPGIQEFFKARPYLEGLDGELIVGYPHDRNVMQQTTSVVMSKSRLSRFSYYVFDMFNLSSDYEARRRSLSQLLHKYEYDCYPVVQYLHGSVMYSKEDVDTYETDCLSLGYEGIVLRNPQGKYKEGRATLKEGNAWKVKRFADDEAELVRIEPLLHNANEAETNELGRTKRSTAKSGLVAMDTMGALVVRNKTFGEFSIGTGFSEEDRSWWFDNWKEVKATKDLIKFKYFPTGIVDKPRHPVFIGIRDHRDV